jgi:hypothetical protein
MAKIIDSKTQVVEVKNFGKDSEYEGVYKLYFKSGVQKGRFGGEFDKYDSYRVNNPNLRLAYYIDKKVTLTLTKYEGYDFYVIDSIEIVKEESETGSNELVEALVNPKKGGNK